MTKVITAPQPIENDGMTVFLAGAIDMGAAIDWQSYAIEKLSGFDNLILFNPRRERFTAETLDEQIKWELDALEKCSVILMHFPANAKAPISFLEAGLYMRSGKLWICAEPGFYRRRNLELTCVLYDVGLFESLDEILSDLIDWMVRAWMISRSS